MRVVTLAGTCVLLLGLDVRPLAAGDALGTAFAGRESLVVRAVAGLAEGAPVWFRVARAHRTVSGGTVRAGADGAVTLPVALPDMKAGVALPLEVTLRAGSEQGRVLRAEATLWALSEQPFEPGHNPAAPRPVWLFDPDGRTEAACRSISLPFASASHLEQLEPLTNAVVLVGEGVAPAAQRGLWDALTAAVARGNRVLLLAPGDGVLRPPPSWRMLVAGEASPVLRPAPPVGWPLDLPVSRRFRLTGLRDEAVFEVSHESGCEAVAWTDASSGGRFVACGLPIVAQWEATPSARWLLAELLAEPR